MRIPQFEIKSRKKIGISGKSPIVSLECMGGLHIVAKDENGLEILGTGNHPGFARFMAKQTDDKIEYDIIEKSEYLDPRFFQDLVPKYRAITNLINNRIDETK